MSDDLFLAKIVSETFGENQNETDTPIVFDDHAFKMKTTLSKLPIFYMVGKEMEGLVIRFNLKGENFDVPINWSWWQQASRNPPYVSHRGEHEDHLLKILSPMTGIDPTTLFYAVDNGQHYLIFFNTKEDMEVESFLFEIFTNNQKKETA